MDPSISPAAPIRECVDTCGNVVKPGDLIQISRDGWSIHWAVYVGDGDVVHLGPARLRDGKGEVLKKKLEDVVKKDKWRVNNLLDEKYPPRPADDIVNKACSLVDTELDYDLEKYNCQNFATEMRYGKPESRQGKDALRAEGEGEAITAEAPRRVESFPTSPAALIKDKDGKEPKPGDLIKISNGRHKHWAVYVGDGDVVHLGPARKKVLKDQLLKVAEERKWTVNNKLDHKYIPRPADDIVEKACSPVDTKKYKRNRSKHFAREMRYGEPDNRQVTAKEARKRAALKLASKGLADATLAGLGGGVLPFFAVVLDTLFKGIEQHKESKNEHISP